MIDVYKLNLASDEELDCPVYRVYSFQRLLTTLKSKINTLVKPALWDDPFENFILQTAWKAFKHQKYDFETMDKFYGQCWSLKAESDAMWRIYSPDKNGIKVKTTIRKLIDSLSEATRDNNGKCFIGEVEYLENEELRNRLLDRTWLSFEAMNYNNQGASFFIKRTEFQHEHEVRILYLDYSKSTLNELFFYPIDPSDLFEEIQFDPRISTEMFDVFKIYLSEKLGYSKPILKSQLYTLPELTFD